DAADRVPHDPAHEPARTNDPAGRAERSRRAQAEHPRARARERPGPPDRHGARDPRAPGDRLAVPGRRGRKSPGRLMPDRRVQAAIDHWAPRFITMGVDYNDFVRTTGRIERWKDWLDAWSAVADEHLERAGAAEAAGRGRSAGEAYLHAALCLHFAKFVWVLDADAHRRVTERALDALYRAHRHLDPSAERIEARLDGHPLAANLRRPAGVERPPLVILIPGLDSTKEEFFHHENGFLARGMATLSMDGPGQGESGFELSIRPDYEVAVAAMLDALGDREDVDVHRVGAVGVSLGGYYAPRAAAFEPRLRAIAAISGPYEFGAGWEELPPLTREAFILKSGARDEAE